MLLHIIPHITHKWGGHRTGNCDQMFKLGWGHRTEFKDRGGGTPHKRIEQMKKTGGGHRTSAAGGRPGGWVAGWVVYQSNNVTLWLHLASWNLPISQLS